MYEYKIKEFVRIYDGDTITMMVDLGFNTFRTERIRLSLIDAPEVRGEERPEGLESRDRLRVIIADGILSGAEFLIRTSKDRKGKYGRYLGEIFMDGVSLNLQLVEEGFAELYQY